MDSSHHKSSSRSSTLAAETHLSRKLPLLFFIEATLLFSVICTHVYLSPFTKVEESFNVQATYDLLYKPWSAIATFDHISFPGVVPRTFITPIVLSSLTRLPQFILNLSPFATLLAFRITLGAVLAISLLYVRNALAHEFSPVTASAFTVFTLVQFHLPFYASRPLPNVLALFFTNLALANRLQCASMLRSVYAAVSLLAFTIALLRSELVLYLAPTIISATHEVLKNAAQTQNAPKVLPTFMQLCICALVTAMVTALLSMCVDSYFWQRLAYPELEVFYFNAVLGKSSAWGTSPFHWYFTNALPRAVGGALLLAVAACVGGCWDAGAAGRLRGVVWPAAVFVLIYSALPHKELRFILYVVPVVNVAAAVIVGDAVKRIRIEVPRWRREDGGVKGHTVRETRRRKGRVLLWSGGVLLVAMASVGVSVLQTVVSTLASKHNYPSAYALRRMHAGEGVVIKRSGMCEGSKEKGLREVWVHIDADSAMNGITQFVYAGGAAGTESGLCEGGGGWKWVYSKREGLEDVELRAFSYVVSGRRRVEGFCVVVVQEAFAGVDWRRWRLRMEEKTFVHRNVNVSSVGCLPSERR